MTRNNNGVKRNFFARFDENGLADFDFFGRERLSSGVGGRKLKMGNSWFKIDKTGDRATGFCHSEVLKMFADLIKEHDGDGFGVLMNGEGADGGEGHEKVFVEDFAFSEVVGGLAEDVEGDEEIAEEVEGELEKRWSGGGVLGGG